MIPKLVSIELAKIFRKLRTYIGFAAVGVLVPIVQIALYYEGQGYVDHATRSIQESFMFTGNLLNGYLVGIFVMQALFIHIPFLIVLVGSDLLAGEATAGTYRMLVARPVSRLNISISKFLAGFIYTVGLMVWLFAVSVLLSLLIFGSGELMVIRDKIYILAADDVMWRYLLAYGYATLSMTMVLALSYFFSSMVENAIGPIVATMALIIIFIVLSALPIEALEPIKPYLFTNHMWQWRDFFADPIDYGAIVESALVLIGHIVVLFGLTTYIFKRKDILS